MGATELIRIGEHVYPPQRTVEGRQRVVGLLLAEAGVAPERVEPLTDAILATVNLNGPHVCSCLHVEGGDDPAHGHGFYQCPECGGLCCTERWSGHAVMGLRWMELMQQQHRHGQIVVRGLNYVQDRLLEAVDQIAAVIPPVQQKAAMKGAIRRWLADLSHIWHQSSLGDYLYQTGDIRGGPTTPRVYEESAERLGEKLAAVTSGISPEGFLARFAPTDAITPEEALRRAHQRQPTPAPVALPDADVPDPIIVPTPEEMGVPRR